MFLLFEFNEWMNFFFLLLISCRHIVHNRTDSMYFNQIFHVKYSSSSFHVPLSITDDFPLHAHFFFVCHDIRMLRRLVWMTIKFSPRTRKKSMRRKFDCSTWMRSSRQSFFIVTVKSQTAYHNKISFNSVQTWSKRLCIFSHSKKLDRFYICSLMTCLHTTVQGRERERWWFPSFFSWSGSLMNFLYTNRYDIIIMSMNGRWLSEHRLIFVPEICHFLIRNNDP